MLPPGVCVWIDTSKFCGIVFAGIHFFVSSVSDFAKWILPDMILYVPY